MKIADLKSLMLVRDGRQLLKVSEVYENYATAQVLLEWSQDKGYHAPSRTRVRKYAANDIEVFFDEPYPSQIQKMDEVYSTPRPSIR